MTNSDFQALQLLQFERILGLGTTKGREYANSDIDRFANFKDIGQDLGVTPEIVLWIYIKKHIRALDTWMKTKGEVSESIHSRIMDIMTYCSLLDGLLSELYIREEDLANEDNEILPLPTQAVNEADEQSLKELAEATNQFRS